MGRRTLLKRLSLGSSVSVLVARSCVPSNGRRVPEGITIPEVGERPAAGELVSVPLSPEEGKKRGWGATKDYAMFGNENYEKLANNLKPVVQRPQILGKKRVELALAFRNEKPAICL